MNVNQQLYCHFLKSNFQGHSVAVFQVVRTRIAKRRNMIDVNFQRYYIFKQNKQKIVLKEHIGLYKKNIFRYYVLETIIYLIIKQKNIHFIVYIHFPLSISNKIFLIQFVNTLIGQEFGENFFFNKNQLTPEQRLDFKSCI